MAKAIFLFTKNGYRKAFFQIHKTGSNAKERKP